MVMQDLKRTGSRNMAAVNRSMICYVGSPGLGWLLFLFFLMSLRTGRKLCKFLSCDKEMTAPNKANPTKDKLLATADSFGNRIVGFPSRYFISINSPT